MLAIKTEAVAAALMACAANGEELNGSGSKVGRPCMVYWLTCICGRISTLIPHCMQKRVCSVASRGSFHQRQPTAILHVAQTVTEFREIYNLPVSLERRESAGRVFAEYPNTDMTISDSSNDTMSNYYMPRNAWIARLPSTGDGVA